MPKSRQSLENACSLIEQSSSLRDTSSQPLTDNYIVLVKRLLPADHKSCLFTVIALAHLVVHFRAYPTQFNKADFDSRAELYKRIVRKFGILLFLIFRMKNNPIAHAF